MGTGEEKRIFAYLTSSAILIWLWPRIKNNIRINNTTVAIVVIFKDVNNRFIFASGYFGRNALCIAIVME